MTEFITIADLRSLLAAIAALADRRCARRPPARDFADWCERQKPPTSTPSSSDWLRSQVPRDRRPCPDSDDQLEPMRRRLTRRRLSSLVPRAEPA